MISDRWSSREGSYGWPIECGLEGAMRNSEDLGERHLEKRCHAQSRAKKHPCETVLTRLACLLVNLQDPKPFLPPLEARLRCSNQRHIKVCSDPGPYPEQCQPHQWSNGISLWICWFAKAQGEPPVTQCPKLEISQLRKNNIVRNFGDDQHILNPEGTFLELRTPKSNL